MKNVRLLITHYHSLAEYWNIRSIAAVIDPFAKTGRVTELETGSHSTDETDR